MPKTKAEIFETNEVQPDPVAETKKVIKTKKVISAERLEELKAQLARGRATKLAKKEALKPKTETKEEVPEVSKPVAEDTKTEPKEEPIQKPKRKPIKEQTAEEQEENHKSRSEKMAQMRQKKIDRKNQLAYELGELHEDYATHIQQLQKEVKHLTTLIKPVERNEPKIENNNIPVSKPPVSEPISISKKEVQTSAKKIIYSAFKVAGW